EVDAAGIRRRGAALDRCTRCRTAAQAHRAYEVRELRGGHRTRYATTRTGSRANQVASADLLVHGWPSRCERRPTLVVLAPPPAPRARVRLPVRASRSLRR